MRSIVVAPPNRRGTAFCITLLETMFSIRVVSFARIALLAADPANVWQAPRRETFHGVTRFRLRRLRRDRFSGVAVVGTRNSLLSVCARKRITAPHAQCDAPSSFVPFGLGREAVSERTTADKPSVLLVQRGFLFMTRARRVSERCLGSKGWSRSGCVPGPRFANRRGQEFDRPLGRGTLTGIASGFFWPV